jgi:hypothetical protein
VRIIEFNDYNLKVFSDFPIKTLKENEAEMDIIIPIDKRTVNLYIKDMPKLISSRIQYVDINSIMIRICKDLANNIGTVHFLIDSGVHSTICNFELDYSNCQLNILHKEFYIDFLIN